MIAYYVMPGLKYRDKIRRKIIPTLTLEQQMDAIISTVCNYLGLDPKTIVRANRRQELVFARQLSVYFIKQTYPHISLKTIGNYLGGRDHTTALHSIKTLRNLMETEEKTREAVREISKLL